MKMTQHELNLIVEHHRKWLRGEGGGVCANLIGADLSGADLRCANLSYADLRYADLSGADLRCANLSGADLRCANLSYADLRYANLSDANLSDANLSDANLRYANLSDANLSDANLSGAGLRCANLSYADLRYANLSDANLWSTIGNQKQIKTIQTDIWQIVYTDTVMQIGCQRHNIEDWFKFDDEKISSMDSQALEWWGKWKPILNLILERES